MKSIILSLSLFLLVTACYSQEETNGTIYIKHPYIDVVNKTAKAYLERDVATNTKLYSDTGRFWVSGLTKWIPIKEAFKMWDSDFNYYDSIQLKVVGYPDYLHYKDQDQKVVQSWWRWTAKSKKTGEKISVDEVIFDTFNSDGKIVSEAIYGDFSKLYKN